MRGSSTAAWWLLSRCLTSPTILLRDLESPRFDEPCRWKELDCATLGDPPPDQFLSPKSHILESPKPRIEVLYLFLCLFTQSYLRNDQMIRDPHIICESHNQPKKTVQSSKHWHLGRNRLLLWTKNALREKSFTKLGYNSGNARKKTFFSIDVLKICLP